MPYTFTITEVTNNITATVYESTVTVTVENIGFTVTETQQVFSLTQYISSFTIYENAIELKVDDFDNYFMGNWSSGGVYERGDLVNYAYSLYVSDINTGTTYTSAATPDVDTTKWRRVVWHEAPFAYATVTDYLYVGGDTTLHDTEVRGNLTLGGGAGVQGLTVNSTATFNGRAIFNNTATFNGDIEFNNNTLVVPKLRVTGTSTFGAYATFNGATFINAPVIIEASSDLRVAGPASFGYIVDGAVGDGRISSFNHTAEFNDIVYLKKGVTVTGKTTSTEFVGTTATIDNLVAKTGSRITTGNLTSNDIISTLGVVAGTNLRVGTTSSFAGTATFNSNVNIAGNLTLSGNLSAANGSLTISTVTAHRVVTDQLNLGGLEYPSNQGLYGQVLTTNGTTTATWVNLGDLTSWSLNEDLYTNGYNIKTGYPVAPLVTPVPDLYIYRGDATHDFGHIKFDRRGSLPANNPYTGTVYQDYQDIEIAAPSKLTLKSGNNGVWGSTSTITINSTTQTNEVRVNTSYIFLDGYIYGNTANDPIKAQSGIRFSDGTVQTTATPVVNIPVASAATTGSVRIDTTYLTIAGDGLLGVNTATLSAAIGGNYTLPIATASILGGIKVGSGLNINAGTGVLSLNTNSVVTVTNNQIDTYFFSTSTTYTITNEVGKLNLTQDAYTNGFTIYHSTGTYNFLTLGIQDSQLGSYRDLTVSAGRHLRLYSENTATLTVTNTATISSKKLASSQSEQVIFTVTQGTQTSSITVNPDNIELLAKTVINFLAPLVSIGTQTSVTQIGQLRVDKIYNYEGTFAPFFPAGVQFNDNTVQRTAFEPNQGLL
jgi:hypothetical protein